jgi:subtilase family protein/type IX secretion system substrate protein
MKISFLFIFLHLFILSVSAQEITRPVRLKSGTLAKSKNLRNQFYLIDSLKKFHFKDRFYTLIQFNTLPDSIERQSLLHDGIVLYDYIPDNTFMAEISDKVAVTRLTKSNIGGIYTLHTTAKISPDLIQELKQAVPDPDKLIAVSFYGNIDKATVIAELKKAGAQIKEADIQPEHVVFIDASMAVIQKIAALPFVSYISNQHFKIIPLDYRNRGAHAVNAVSALAGRNLQGANVTVGVGDAGYPGAHIDLAGRLLNENFSLASLHPTISTGTVAGGGNLVPRYKGMAPEATIISKITTQVLTGAPQLVTDYNMVLTNNSYGVGPPGCRGGGYIVASNYIDGQMKNYPSLLHVFAAGNEGDDAICTPYPAGFATVVGGYQSAKNVLTVGAIDNFTYTIANFSSRGPVTDGRLKPELVAGGNGVATTIPDNKYITAYGTSCSAPIVTGILALLYERYRQLHGGSNPSSALIKAVACNGAVDMGNPGPDYTFGFGNINARNSVEALENNTWFTGALNNGGSTSFTIPSVPAGTAQIKILLYWNDPAAAVNAASALVNNLDLTVTTPDATVHYPLILDPAAANVNNAAVEGIDNRNNIEQVVINNPPAGNCTVTVNGSSIAQGPQDYVVVYQVIQPGVTVEYPFGEETLVPGEQEIIRWNASDPNTNTFTIEYSLNNGGSWITIDNNAAATSRSYVWNIPTSVAATAAAIRVSRNNTAYKDVNDYSFVVLDTTSVIVTDTTAFAGNAKLLWSSIPAATSYDVMMLRGKNMQVIANVTNTSYSLSGLSIDTAYWVAVRGVVGTTAGRRSTAQCINPKAIPPDLTVVVYRSFKGRKYTSSQLGILNPQVLILSQRYSATSGNASVSYQVNGNTPITETVPINLGEYANTTYTFATGYDFSNVGNYNVKVWIDYPGDTSKNNDTSTFTNAAVHLPNDPIVMNPSFTEGFENAAVQTCYNGTLGINGLDRCDFYSTNRGRARTFIDAAMVRTGDRAITLDQDTDIINKSADSLITTFNLSNYISSNEDLWLSLYFRNEGIDFSAPGNKIWIRGSDRDAWIPVYTLPTNSADFGVYRAMPNVNITQALANASPVQTISSSFQVKCGQEGNYPASITPGVDNDGFTFDDITIGFINQTQPTQTGLVITLKPNPVTQGVLYINSTANCSRIELRDVTGRLVKTVSVNGMQTQLTVHEVARGMYFVTVVTDNGSEVKKVLVE